MTRTRAAGLAAVVTAVALTGTGCGSDPDDGRFLTGDASAYPLACLEHQPDKPGRAYTGAENGETLAVLSMLRYYTANKNVRHFCDNQGPTTTDLRWVELYVDLGAERANVSHWLE